MPRAILLAALALLAAAAVRAAEPALTVSSPQKTLLLSADDFGRLLRTEVVATDPHEKASHRYSGVAVRDLLASVGAPLADKLRGPALQLAVLVRSLDGYAVLYALPEFDESFSYRTIIVADRIDGAPIAGKAGPLRIIVPGDKHAARWIRMVKSIEIIQPAGPIAPRTR
jgi:hypothetical protein